MSFDISELGTAAPKHFAFQIRTGKMDEAIHFFELIGWKEVNEAMVYGEWGQARFVTPNEKGRIFVQLTELSDGDPDQLEMTENHLAISFKSVNSKDAAQAIYFWACSSDRTGQKASMEAASEEGTKWFVYIPSLFKFAIEII